MANVPIYLNQGGTVLTIGEGGSIDTSATSADVATGKTLVGSKMFISSVQTGDGMAQNVAHFLGVTPSAYVIIPQVVPMGAGGEFSAVVDAMNTDETNIVCTVTDQVDYQVVAWA
tara:strand:+ start:1512 stop:1856 length:345 start_codon:yes stop_codon:yes gene_type:complete